MPSYEVRYLNSEGDLALIHKTHHENDEAVDQAAYRMLVRSGFSPLRDMERGRRAFRFRPS